jgi:hypothetical protein
LGLMLIFRFAETNGIHNNFSDKKMFNKANFKSCLIGRFQLMAVIATLIISNFGCQSGNLLDPTRVQNDNVTDEIFNGSLENSSRGVVAGLRRTLAIGYGNLLILSELTSDNYANATSFVSVNLDTPTQILGTDLTLGGGAAYNNLLRLNAAAEFAFINVFPRDPLATSLQRAETRFIQGLGLLLLSENWTLFPIVDKALPITARQAREIAIEKLTESLTLAATTPRTFSNDNNAIGDGLGDIRMNCFLALERTHRMQGDKNEARRWGDSALAINPNYVYYARYDAQNLGSAISQHVRLRTDHNFQPLPRLEFLDPKIPNDPGLDPIPMLKTEEVYLIRAEIALSDNNLAEAKTQMREAVRLTRSRATLQFIDANESRRATPAGAALSTLISERDRPSVPGRVIVRSSPTAPIDTAYATSLVRFRGRFSAPFALPIISGTSLTEARIDALPNTRADLVRTLYLLRQEIFFLESRRMSDLGIRFPVPETQTQTNANMRLGSPGTLVLVPDWIPAGNAEMNRYTVATSGGFTIVTIANDMNDVIARNIARISPFSGW